jgi:hypothetical protein
MQSALSKRMDASSRRASSAAACVARPHRFAAAALLALVTGTAAAAPVTVVEYYNAALDHYFISPLASDIDALDAGVLQGWSRTGRNFLAYGLTGTDFPAGSPVCRYYIPPQHGDSHFFSASPAECAEVAARVAADPDDSGYLLETPAAFFAALPDALTGTCATGLQPLYRLWNQRADSNHRYVTDPALRADMLAQGYVAEGYGDLGVAMCVAGAVLGDAVVDASAPSPYAPGCDGATPPGSVAYAHSEVEPSLAVNPQNPANLIGAWQQDRWSDGGARGLRTAYSTDGGRTWRHAQAAFTRCSGGSATNGGDYARASDPWVAIGPSGIAYQIAIAFTGGTFAPGSTGAVLASRSLDGGATWSAPATLIRDGRDAFNDKESITADPTDARYAYAVWDRVLPTGSGPAWLARTTDGGATWEPARPIYAPGGVAQTINNQVVVLPDGTLLLMFTELSNDASNPTAKLGISRSGDKGVTWSAPTFVGPMLSIGTRDPASGVTLRDAGNLASIAVGRNGAVALAWQDARFSAGAVEGIAFSRSLDGGITWSAPVQVNRVRATQALLPSVAIRDDGTYAVQYYDLRNDTPDPAVLRSDTWLVQSTDGVAWRETHLAGPFDFARAPLVREGAAFGYFLGDYQALTVSGGQFLGFFAQTTRVRSNVSDVFASIVTRPGAAPVGFKAREAAPGAKRSPALSDAVARNISRTVSRRLNGP